MHIWHGVLSWDCVVDMKEKFKSNTVNNINNTVTTYIYMYMRLYSMQNSHINHTESSLWNIGYPFHSGRHQGLVAGALSSFFFSFFSWRHSSRLPSQETSEVRNPCIATCYMHRALSVTYTLFSQTSELCPCLADSTEEGSPTHMEAASGPPRASWMHYAWTHQASCNLFK